MSNAILIDAGPLIALFDRDDTYHKDILAFLKEGRYQFVSTAAVLTEVMYMLDFNVEVQIHFLMWIMQKGVIIHELKQKDIARIIELTRKYCDRPMDFADATLVVAAEETGIRKIISIDADFDIYRLHGKIKIENIFRS